MNTEKRSILVLEMGRHELRRPWNSPGCSVQMCTFTGAMRWPERGQKTGQWWLSLGIRRQTPGLWALHHSRCDTSFIYSWRGGRNGCLISWGFCRKMFSPWPPGFQLSVRVETKMQLKVTLGVTFQRKLRSGDIVPWGDIIEGRTVKKSHTCDLTLD